MTDQDNSDQDAKVGPSKSDLEFAARVSELVSDFRGVANIARAAGVSERVVRKWAAGESQPAREHLVALADAAGCRIEWLAAGRGPKHHAEDYEVQPSADIVMLPVWAAKASAGSGSGFVMPDVEEYFGFTAKFIRHLGLSPESGAVFRVEGDSMEDTIFNGEYVIVDASVAAIDRSGVYILAGPHGLQCKRLELHPITRGITIISDNTRYRPIEVTEELAAQLHVVGRVKRAISSRDIA